MLQKNELPLTIEGEVEFHHTLKIMRRLEELLDAIAEEVAPGVPIRWTVRQAHRCLIAGWLVTSKRDAALV